MFWILSYSRVEKRIKEDTSVKDDVKKKSKPLPSMPRPPSPPNASNSLKYALLSLNYVNLNCYKNYNIKKSVGDSGGHWAVRDSTVLL